MEHLGARTLLEAPGRTILYRSKKLLGAPGLPTRNKKLLGAYYFLVSTEPNSLVKHVQLRAARHCAVRQAPRQGRAAESTVAFKLSEKTERKGNASETSWYRIRSPEGPTSGPVTVYFQQRLLLDANHSQGHTGIVHQGLYRNAPPSIPQIPSSGGTCTEFLARCW